MKNETEMETEAETEMETVPHRETVAFETGFDSLWSGSYEIALE